MTLEQEAEKYAKKEVPSDEWKPECDCLIERVTLKKGFIAGAASKWIEIEKIKYAISILKKFTDEYGWFQAIEDLEKELKQLQQ